MFDSNLPRTYAERFCREFKPKIINKKFIFGHSETWPAQIDGYSFLISQNHSHRKINYRNLKNIIQLESPRITERDYKDYMEYKKTIETMFQATIAGMKFGKIERIIERKNQGLLNKFLIYFSKDERNTLDKKSILKRIENFRKTIPEYWGMHKVEFPIK